MAGAVVAAWRFEYAQLRLGRSAALHVAGLVEALR